MVGHNGFASLSTQKAQFWEKIFPIYNLPETSVQASKPPYFETAIDQPNNQLMGSSDRTTRGAKKIIQGQILVFVISKPHD